VGQRLLLGLAANGLKRAPFGGRVRHGSPASRSTQRPAAVRRPTSTAPVLRDRWGVVGGPVVLPGSARRAVRATARRAVALYRCCALPNPTEATDTIGYSRPGRGPLQHQEPSGSAEPVVSPLGSGAGIAVSTCAHRHSLNNRCELESSGVLAGQDARADIGAGVGKRQRGEGR
jgi:hypothetical protein